MQHYLLGLLIALLSTNAFSIELSAQFKDRRAESVEWNIVTPEIFERAKKSNKLIFVSIGFDGCVECEEFYATIEKTKEVKEELDQKYISVFVDKDVQSGVDEFLYDYAEKIGDVPGYPINMLMTPSGEPFVVFSKLPAGQLRGFLSDAALQWVATPQIVRTIVDKYKDVRKQFAVKRLPDSDIDLNLEKKKARYDLYKSVRNNADLFQGGLNAEQKFIYPVLLKNLINFADTPKQIDEWIMTTLDNINHGEIHDSIDGGFYLYSRSSGWGVPYLVKDLSDNALIAELYFDAYKKYKNPEYLSVAYETLDYIVREFRNSATGLYFHRVVPFKRTNGFYGQGQLMRISDVKKAMTPTRFKEYIVSNGYQGLTVSDYILPSKPRNMSWEDWELTRSFLKMEKEPEILSEQHIFEANALLLNALISVSEKDKRYTKEIQELSTALIRWVQTSVSKGKDKFGENIISILELRDAGYGIKALSKARFYIEDNVKLSDEERSQLDKSMKTAIFKLYDYLEKNGWNGKRYVSNNAYSFLGDFGETLLPSESKLPSPVLFFDQNIDEKIKQNIVDIQLNPAIYSSYLFSN